MSRRAYKTSIPADAVEVVRERHGNGARKSASYFVGDEEVGVRLWEEDGQLTFESPRRNGLRHGDEYRFHSDGRLLEVQPYRDNQMHGVGKQWSRDGRLLVTWKLVRNAGLDLWCDTETETLAEEHYWPKEGELGYERQWNCDERTLWQEYSYVLGRGYHGVRREWNAAGRLWRGFPCFHVNAVKVTRRRYLKACQDDPLLPAYRPEEDDPHRLLPAKYIAQRLRRRRK